MGRAGEGKEGNAEEQLFFQSTQAENLPLSHPAPPLPHPQQREGGESLRSRIPPRRNQAGSLGFPSPTQWATVLSNSPGERQGCKPKGMSLPPWMLTPVLMVPKRFQSPPHPTSLAASQDTPSSHPCTFTSELRGTHGKVTQVTNAKVGIFHPTPFKNMLDSSPQNNTAAVSSPPAPNQYVLQPQQQGFTFLEWKGRKGTWEGRTEQLQPTPSSSAEKLKLANPEHPGALGSQGGSTQAVRLIIFFPPSGQAEQRGNEDKCVQNRNAA